MKINFNYEKNSSIDYVSGDIFKGKHYRCNYMRYNSLYSNPANGTETVQIYNFTPKEEIYASVLILHGLGSSNIKFLQWMATHLAATGINSTILILPGNYTRVDKNSVSGRNYLWPDINVMYRFWEHAVVDTLSTIDFLEENSLWKKDNCIMGYCLGGMISTIVETLDERIKNIILMTTGGDLPNIMYKSPAGKFIRRMFEKGFEPDYFLSEKEKLLNTYNNQFKSVKKMSLNQILTDEKIHPLFKIDPISYAHLINPSKVTFINALFDRTLSIESRSTLLKELNGCKKYSLPVGHVSWLPFEFFLAKYIMQKLGINSLKLKSRLLKKEEPLEEYENLMK